MKTTTYVLFLALTPGSMIQATCPALSEPCMNEENLRDCQQIEEQGCKQVITMESCPLQFACGDKSRDIDAAQQSPDACVSVYVYENEKCENIPKRVLTFPTWSQPGSECYHDASMPHSSVASQFCNAETGNWHELVFLASDQCEPTSPYLNLTLATDSCVGGFRLKECIFGPCPSGKAESSFEHVLSLDPVAVHV